MTDLPRVAVAQFTAHARSFATSPLMNDGAALDALAALAGLGDGTVASAGGAGPAVLDVACGPGIVAVELARRGADVTGIDLTPAMVELASARAAEAGVAARCRFQVASMEQLPFADGRFPVVVSRYALHHAGDAAAVAAEMARVVAPRGRVVVVDFAAVDDPVAAAAYDGAERLRDPSHVRNLTVAEQVALFERLGLRVGGSVTYRLAADLDEVLARSHGVDHDGVRRAFEASLDRHGLGVGAHDHDGRIRFEYPIAGHWFTAA